MSKVSIDPNSHLLPETATQYEVVDWVGGHKQFFGKFGTVNLKTLTYQQAAVLVKSGFSKLLKKEETKTNEDPKSKVKSLPATNTSN